MNDLPGGSWIWPWLMYGKTGDRTNGKRQAQMEKHLEAFEELIIQLIGWQSHKKGQNFAECLGKQQGWWGLCCVGCVWGHRVLVAAAAMFLPLCRATREAQCSVPWSAGL